MNYEIINLESKIIVGISAVTSNNDPKMCEIIGSLWMKLYQDGIAEKIRNKANDYAVGLYSDYNDKDFCVTVGNEVTQGDNSDLTLKIIPAGKYAKFSVHGHVEKVVSQAWQNIWTMDLDRSFTGDFEEYLTSDYENADINIYVALK